MNKHFETYIYKKTYRLKYVYLLRIRDKYKLVYINYNSCHINFCITNLCSNRMSETFYL